MLCTRATSAIVLGRDEGVNAVGGLLVVGFLIEITVCQLIAIIMFFSSRFFCNFYLLFIQRVFGKYLFSCQE